MEYNLGMDGIGSIPTGDATLRQPLQGPQDNSLREQKDTDRKVRAHEQAHLAAAGNLATGGPRYELKTGEDGKNYAVGGEVNIRVSEGKTPSETLQRAQQAQRAALAPADPSPQDLRVAQEAQTMATKARAELSRSSTDGTKKPGSVKSTPTPALGSSLDMVA